MSTATTHPAVLEGIVGPLAALVAALVTVVLLHRASWFASRRQTVALFAMRIAADAVAWWGALGVLGRWLTFTSPWPTWSLAVAGGLVTEVLVAALNTERTMSPRWPARVFIVLRLTTVVLLILVLAAPVWRKVRRETVDRYVALLVDDSASMQIADPRPSARTMLWAASRAGFPLKPWPRQLLDDAATETALARQSDELSLRLDRVAHADAASAARQLNELLPILDAFEKESIASVGKFRDSVETALQESTTLDAATRGQLAALERQFVHISQAIPRADSTDVLNAASQRLQNLRASLAKIADTAPPAADAASRAYLEDLPGEIRAQVSAMAGKSRATLAHQLLFESTADAPSICDVLRKDYQVRLYQFAADARQATLPDGAGQPAARVVPPPGTQNDAKQSDAGAQLTRWRQSTNLAAGLDLAMTEMPLDRLAGVIVLSDGRVQHAEAVQPVAARLHAAGVPVSGIVIGSSDTFRDAAVASVNGPRTVLLGDKATLTARLKCHGFQGKTVIARLWYENEKVDQRSVSVSDDRFTADVELSHLPRKLGAQTYRIDLSIDGIETPHIDTVPANDSREHRLVVTDDRIQVLIVETAPRWEFRYLRNLFLGRNKAVHVQYVVVRPDQIEGHGLPRPVAVSVSRSEGAEDGSTLPSTAEEWMKFDVIVLGDVDPRILSPPVQRTLVEFVEKRGGTLVAMAGPEFMPRAYHDSTLADLLPVENTKSSALSERTRDSAYRLALTAEGARHPLAALADNPADSLAAWNAAPNFQWRDGDCHAKPAAEVLAYAVAAGSGSGRGERADLAPQQSELVRAVPLIAWHRFGAGKVLELMFDETWRLRYRAGEKYHGRFWNQVLRWATPDKLPAGTSHVRLGTDRADYEPGQTLRVRAQLTDAHGDGVVAPDLRAVLLREKTAIREALMTADAIRPGWYAAELGALKEPGTYRIELHGAKVDELIARDHNESVAHDHQEPPSTDVLVGSPETSTELIDLEADDAVLRQAAGLTHGQLADVASAHTVLKSLGSPSYEIEHESLFSLWDRWPVLLVFLLLLTGEWIIRRRVGLI